MPDLIALIDCNNFYVSCERVFNPSLKNIPIAILSNNDGCIVSRSQELKNLGVKMGTPYFKARKLIEENKGRVFSSNYELYGDMSNRIMAVLGTFSENIEIYSIDEAFITIPDKFKNELGSYCSDIYKTVYQWTGIPVKIGVAKTKTLAKLAAEKVKKERITENFKILLGEEEIKRSLKNTPLIDIWGIGRKTAEKLRDLRMHKAADILELDESFIRKKFSVVLVRTVMELKNTPCIELETLHENQKNLCVSRSFGKPVSDLDSMLESVVYYASSAAEKLRNKKLKARSVTVYITTNFFSRTQKKYSNSRTLAFPFATNSTKLIIEYAKKALDPIFINEYKYKKSGVILNDLVPENIEQMDLFEAVDEKDSRLSSIMDEINKKFGRGSIKYLSEGLNKNWLMRRELKSNSYTTKWEELLNIK